MVRALLVNKADRTAPYTSYRVTVSGVAESVGSGTGLSGEAQPPRGAPADALRIGQ